MPPARLLVLASPAAAELSLLSSLAAPPLGVGRSLAELRESGLTDEALSSVEVLLTCGVGPQAATAEALREVFCACPRLRWVHSCSAGVNHCLFPELVASPLPLTNARGVYSGSLAEWALFSCMWFARDLPRLLAQKADSRWHQYDVEELRGRSLAVVGYGDIGQASARLARAFGMNVLALRRSAAEPDAVVSRYFHGADGLKEMVSRADYVLLATPLTEDTRGLVSSEVLACMQQRAVFINVGRGPCVDEPALVRSLQEGRLRGAALDVFTVEPLSADSPLWAMPNVLLSPHNVRALAA